MTFDAFVSHLTQGLLLTCRYAVWLKGAGRTNEAADQILERVAGRVNMEGKALKDLLFEYTIKQAEKDERIQGYTYNNYYFLVSYGPITAEAPHLNGNEPDARFTLAVSDKIQPTQTYAGQSITDGNSFVSALGLDKDLKCPPDLLKKLGGKLNHLPILQQMGNLLAPDLAKCPSPDTMARGSLSVFPGRVVHADPATIEPAASLFLTGHQSVRMYLPIG